MILSTIAGGSRLQASRGEYLREWLQGIDTETVMSDTGEPVMPSSALRVAVVHRGINVLAHAIASVPLNVFERHADDSRSLARDQQSYKLLHDRPNTWMTSFRFRHLMMVRAVLYGDSYHQLLPGPMGISQIVPLEPSTTRVVDQTTSGKLIYVTRDLTNSGYGQERKLVQDEVLHVRGMSLDGKRGIPLMDVAKNAIGLALSAEKHGSMFLRNGARFAGVLTAEGNLGTDARKDNEEAWQRAYGGGRASGLTPLLEGGVKYEAISSNNKDSQWQEAREFQIEELLRFLGVPGVLCAYAKDTSTYASAEQFFLSFVKDTVRPWTENIAAELNMSVITQPDRYFTEFDLDGLLKGDIKTRYTAHREAIFAGWKSRNETRREENYDPGPPELDHFLEPLNMTAAGKQPGDPAEDPATAPSDGRPPAAIRDFRSVVPGAAAAVERAMELAIADARAAGQVATIQLVQARGQLQRAREREATRAVRREVAWAKSKGVRFASDPPGWRLAVLDYYKGHGRYLQENLELTEEQATSYCAEQARQLVAEGLAIVEKWEAEVAPRLALLALGEGASPC